MKKPRKGKRCTQEIHLLGASCFTLPSRMRDFGEFSWQSLDVPHYYLLQLSIVSLSLLSSIDATKESGRMGRLINHSRKHANLIPRLFEMNDLPHLCFLAADDIEPQQELMYDYGERSSDIVAHHPWLSY